MLQIEEEIKRILVVGLGSIGKRHLRLVRGILPDAEIWVLRHQLCQEVPEYSDGCFNTLKQACEFKPQAAIIANPAPFHLEIANTLADVGSHLLIEKPLSNNVEGVTQLISKMHDRNQFLQIGYNLRFLPSLKVFRDQVHSGKIGRVLSVRCEIGQYLPSWRPDSDYRQTVSAQRSLGGGVLLELSHELDYLRWIFGEVDWVSAWLGNISDLEVDVEDIAQLTLSHKNSEKQNVLTSLNMDFLRHDTTRLCSAIGDKGTLRWNVMAGSVELFQAGNDTWQQIYQYAHHRDESYRTQMQHFLESVKKNVTTEISGEDGLAVLRIIEAARQSALKKCKKIHIHNNETMA